MNKTLENNAKAISRIILSAVAVLLVVCFIFMANGKNDMAGYTAGVAFVIDLIGIIPDHIADDNEAMKEMNKNK